MAMLFVAKKDWDTIHTKIRANRFTRNTAVINQDFFKSLRLPYLHIHSRVK